MNDIDLLNKETDEAIVLFNDSKNPEIRAFAFGWITCINFLVEKKMVKIND